MARREHPLLERFPVTGTTTLSTGDAPVPYRVTAGTSLFIGGTADLALTQKLVANESVQLVQNRDGRALMGIWLCDFTDASLGPHHELQFSFFIANDDDGGGDEDDDVLDSHPFALAAALSEHRVRMLCHGLWNNSEAVVAYNRERLSLNARFSLSQMECDHRMFTAEVMDGRAGNPLLSATVHQAGQQSLQANLAFIGALSFAGLWQLMRQPWVTLSVVNPRGVVLDENADAEAHAANAKDVVRFFDAGRSTLRIEHPAYQRLGFVPQYSHFSTGNRFVYLDPQTSRSRSAIGSTLA